MFCAGSLDRQLRTELCSAALQTPHKAPVYLARDCPLPIFALYSKPTYFIICNSWRVCSRPLSCIGYLGTSSVCSNLSFAELKREVSRIQQLFASARRIPNIPTALGCRCCPAYHVITQSKEDFSSSASSLGRPQSCGTTQQAIYCY